MKFLVTSKGFLKEVKRERVKDENGKTTGITTEIIYTDKLREAHIFSTKGKAMEFG